MGRRRNLRRITAVTITVVGIAAIAALATGEVGLVTTHGVSMEPRFHTGDLAVIVPSGSYHTGEIVGYHSPLLHITVLHRIVAEHDGLFTFKGDNNSFLDPTNLPASAIKGRLWLHVPHGGVVLGWVRSPFALGFLIFVVVALGIGRRVSRRQRAASPRPSAPGPRHSGGKDHDALPHWRVAVPAVLAATCTLLACVAFAHPATVATMRSVSYGQQVVFGYSATAPVGTAYPTGTVATGDPVFLHLVHRLDVRATYVFRDTTPAEHGPVTAPGHGFSSAPVVRGTIGATAILLGPGGWSGTLAQVAPVAFSGTAASVDLPIDLSNIAALEQQFDAETGIPLGDATIVVSPSVQVRAAVEGTSVLASDTPSLRFQTNGTELGIAVAASQAGPSSAATEAALTATSSGSQQLASSAPARLDIVGKSVSVTTARLVALAGVVLCGLLLVAGRRSLARRRAMGQAERIRAAHGHDLVPVAASPAHDAKLVVELDNLGALFRLARRYDCLVMELAHPGGQAYYVECGATVYRFGPEPDSGEPDSGNLERDDADAPTEPVLSVVPGPWSRNRPAAVPPAGIPAPPANLTYFVADLPPAG
jgi:signal peptidase I